MRGPPSSCAVVRAPRTTTKLPVAAVDLLYCGELKRTLTACRYVCPRRDPTLAAAAAQAHSESSREPLLLLLDQMLALACCTSWCTIGTKLARASGGRGMAMNLSKHMLVAAPTRTPKGAPLHAVLSVFCACLRDTAIQAAWHDHRSRPEPLHSH